MIVCYSEDLIDNEINNETNIRHSFNYDDDLNSLNQGYFGETILNEIVEKEISMFNDTNINKSYFDNTDYNCDIYFNNQSYKINDKDETINFLNKKTNREKETITKNKNKKDIYIITKIKKPNINNETNIKKDSTGLDLEENEEKNKNRCGRKNKTDKSNRMHNQFCEDNIINKIKGYFINSFMREFIRKHSINGGVEFKKLPSIFISDLTKEKNERLYKTKIKDILYEEEISTKYSTCNIYENRKIIDKIYKEKKEINVIKILELTFEELFIIFRRKLNDPEDMEKLKEIKDKIKGLDLLEKNNNFKDIEYLIKDIKDKYNKKLGESELNDYIENVKNLCLGYENWFLKKIGRIF